MNRFKFVTKKGTIKKQIKKLYDEEKKNYFKSIHYGTIKEDETWERLTPAFFSRDMFLYHCLTNDVVVPKGVTLTIKDTEVRITGKTITVEYGAKVVIKNSTIRMKNGSSNKPSLLIKGSGEIRDTDIISTNHLDATISAQDEVESIITVGEIGDMILGEIIEETTNVNIPHS